MASQSWKWIRVHEDLCDDLKSMGEFGESFNDIISRLLYYYNNNDGNNNKDKAMTISKDEAKARLKKFDSHTKAIARLVRQNITYADSGSSV